MEVSMNLDSTALYLLSKELRDQLYFASVRQIHQIDHRIMDLELFRPDNKPVHLIINTYTPILYLTTSDKYKNQYTPSQTFCMTLRKHLEGSRISNVEQMDGDRIIVITFDRIEFGGMIQSKKLWVELLPAAPNLILTENDLIIDACIKGKKQQRVLSPYQPYESPMHSNRLNFLEFSAAELFEHLSFATDEEITIKDFIFTTYNGFSSFLLEEVLSRLHLPSSQKLVSLDKETKKSLADEIYNIAKELKESTEVMIYQTAKGTKFVSPISLSTYTPLSKSSLLKWLDNELQNPTTLIANKVQDYNKKLHSLLKKEIRKEKKILQELEETEFMEQYKLWGNLLSIYSYLKPHGVKEITVSNIFEAPPKDISIPIDPLKSIIVNSQLYFKKYNKMKTRLSYSEQKLDECRIQIDYLQNMIYFLSNVNSLKKLEEIKEELQSLGITQQNKQTKKNKKLINPNPQLETRTIDGFKVFIGNSNVENEYLTLHKAQKHDIWLHAKGIPGSHVVIETERKEVPIETIAKVAQLAALKSKGKNSGKVDVDYTFIKNVKKVPKTPAGFVTFTGQKTLLVSPEDIE